MSDLTSVRIIVYGYVQGVLFRNFVLRRARELELVGYVRNMPSGAAVEVQAEGEKERLEKLMEQLKIGPPRAEVEQVEASWSKYSDSYSYFNIRY